MSYTDQQKSNILELARDAVNYAVRNNSVMPINLGSYDPFFSEIRSTFITLHSKGDLRGCIGHIMAIQSLAEDIADNAYSAAFRDSRFEPVFESELCDLAISVSILDVPEPIEFDDEEHLLRQLRPHIDGVVIEDGGRCGVFLPIMWERFPDPTEFLSTLKVKAGMPRRQCTRNLKASRFTVEYVSDGEEEISR